MVDVLAHFLQIRLTFHQKMYRLYPLQHIFLENAWNIQPCHTVQRPLYKYITSTLTSGATRNKPVHIVINISPTCLYGQSTH